MLNSGDVMSRAQAGAKTGPKSAPAREHGLAKATVSAIVSAAILSGTLAVTPSYAQLAPDAPSVETPFGRAPLSFADVIEKVKPSVVSISVVAGGNKTAGKTGKNGLPEGFPDIPEDSPFYDFFKNLPKEFRNQPQQQRPTQAQGSGFIISSDGYVVTNNHVIDGANKIQVSFDDQEKLDAELVGTDPRTDIALLEDQGQRQVVPGRQVCGQAGSRW